MERRLTGGHARFSLILGGGGARGYAHAGVLRSLNHFGLYPSAIVGVSMGAVVGATYSLRDDWYEALMAMDTHEFPGPSNSLTPHARLDASRLRDVVATAKALWTAGRGWGVGSQAVEAGWATLPSLIGECDLSDGSPPLAVAATDLISGHRVVFASGAAAEAVYASSALAGIVPPLADGTHLLADGAYADLCPVDVARKFGHPIVVAVDPGQADEPIEINNGLQAILRATEVCYLRHAELRFDEADFVIRPRFRRAIDTLDFAARRECVAAGVRAARAALSELERLLTGARVLGG